MKRIGKYLLGLGILAGLAASSLAVAGPSCDNVCLKTGRDAYRQCLRDGLAKDACSAIAVQAYYDCLTACTP